MKTINFCLSFVLLVCMSLPGLYGQSPERQQLLPLKPVNGEGIGLATATDGHYFVSTTRATRQVYVFEREGIYWLEVARLKGMNDQVDMMGSKGFGQVVAVANERIAVAAPESYATPGAEVGLVETFTKVDGIWQLESVIRAPQPEAKAAFGKAIALQGNHLLVGAPHSSDKTGQAVLYTFDDGQWNASTLLVPDLKAGSEMGASVALHGDLAIVGAPGYASRRSSNGALFVFQQKGKEWTLIQTIEGSGRTENLGRSLAARNDMLMAGAFESVELFALAGNQWIETQTLKNPDLGSVYSFASSLTLSPNGQHLLVSASQHVYLYSQANGQWELLATITEDQAAFGSSSSMGDDFFILNAPYAGTDFLNGAVYQYWLAPFTDAALR